MIILHAMPPNPRLPSLNIVLLCLLVLAGLAAAVLVSLGWTAFSRRQSRSYLLVVLALGTLVCKAFAGGFTVVGILPGDLHHFVEHSLDLIMAMLLIAAVYYARTASPEIREVND